MENGGTDHPMCKVCKAYILDINHNNSINHRYNFLIWSYQNYRKALSKNRHGIVLSVKEENNNNFKHILKLSDAGKYVLKVSPEQLQLNEKTILFNCSIANKRSKDSVYITNVNLLHSSNYFKIISEYNFANDEILQLYPAKQYQFKIVFSTKELVNASYKIPLMCDIQTTDNKESFSIIRTFLIIIDDIDQEELKKKSPFTSESWKDIKRKVPSTQHTNIPDVYPIPKAYCKVIKCGLEIFEGITKSESRIIDEIKTVIEELTLKNYNKFWHFVLWIEETGHILMLRRYNMSNVNMQLRRQKILVLEVPGLAEKRPSVVIGDIIQIRLHNDHTVYFGNITGVNDETVEIQHMDEEFMEIFKSQPHIELDVSFTLKRLAFERMHKAVDMAMKNGMAKILFPQHIKPTNKYLQSYALSNSDFYNQDIINNHEQKTAVLKILNHVKQLPYIIFGPPGTGKTITIVEAILQIKKKTKKKILVCAPANAACDVIAVKLLKYCKEGELIRIHSQTRETSSLTDELRNCSNLLGDEFVKIELDKNNTFRIIVTTLTLIGKFSTTFHPDCVFVDEAAQASEPETLIALSLLSPGKQIILAGDPMQLGPMTTDLAAKYGLGTSLLERLMRYDIYKPNLSSGLYDQNFITMLKLNFRSAPKILLIPNQLFYNNKLIPISTSATNDPVAKLAIYPAIYKCASNSGEAIEFCSLSSKERREGSSPSYFNLSEAKMVIQYIKVLVTIKLPPEYKVKLEEIGVITPYKRQVFKIKQQLNFHGLEKVEVGTTESFQGREKRIILISTVRAQHSLLRHDRKYNLGFVKNDQRFNVAMTRAISKLIVIGSPLVLSRDDKWAMYMTYCKKFGTYFGNMLEPADVKFKKEVLERMKHFQPKDDQYKK